MRSRAMVSNFLIMKLGVFLAIFILLAASVDTYHSFERSQNKQKKKEVADFVIDSIEEASSLPGNVHIERKVPDLGEPYELHVSGTMENFQIVEVSVIGSEEVKRIALLNKRLNGGRFDIGKKNPERVIISKDNGLFLEVV